MVDDDDCDVDDDAVAQYAFTVERQPKTEFIYSLKSFCALSVSIIHAMMTCSGDGHRIE